MIDIVPIQNRVASLHHHQQLFSQCFSLQPKFSVESLEWLYMRNPEGTVIGFDAWHSGELVAHYACVPAVVMIGHEKVRAILSLNTATHPKFQGQGLFTKLAERTYQAASDLGFDCVYGVANANSTPGFTRKLGFQLVQPLDAKIGFGSIRLDSSVVRQKAEFRRLWTEESLQWRCSNPANPVLRTTHGDLAYCRARTMKGLAHAYGECIAGGEFIGNAERLPRTPLHVYLGLEPEGSSNFGTYIDIPNRFKPSPLNFIYRSLSSRLLTLSEGQISFSFLDFDAY